MNRIQNVALPDEIPPPPQLPSDPNALHSGTVESLLIQNEDLTARLAVSHRRNGEMERRMREMQCEYSELQKRLEVLSDQILVYREKDKAVKTRQAVFEKNIERLKNQLEMQNIRYADLYNATKKDHTFLYSENQKLQKQVGVLQRYRNRIMNHIAPLIRNQKEKIAEQKTALQDLHRHLGESGEHIKRQKEQLSQQQETYREETAKLAVETESLRPFREKYLKLKEERTVHQNRVIAAERTRDDLLARHREEVHRLQEAVSQFRAEAKSLKLELQDSSTRLENSESSVKNLGAENERLRDQTESLQALWTSTSKKLETAAAKEEALQKLNQELSRQLKDLRSGEGSQKTEYLQKIEEQEKTIQLLSTELELLKSNSPSAAPTAAAAVPLETVKKLESLLNEIHNGYKNVPFQLPNHRFAESEELISEQGDLEL